MSKPRRVSEDYGGLLGGFPIADLVHRRVAWGRVLAVWSGSAAIQAGERKGLGLCSTQGSYAVEMMPSDG